MLDLPDSGAQYNQLYAEPIFGVLYPMKKLQHHLAENTYESLLTNRCRKGVDINAVKCSAENMGLKVMPLKIDGRYVFSRKYTLRDQQPANYSLLTQPTTVKTLVDHCDTVSPS